MTLENLRAFARAIIPGCKTDVVSNILLDQLLNAGVHDIAVYTKCLPTNKKFSAVASQGDILNPYIISTVIGDYLLPDKAGLWWNRGTVAAPDYKQLWPRTEAWLDKNRPNWRDIDDGDPQDYLIHGNNLIIIPAPDTALTDAFWLFYFKTPTTMANVASYPFSGSTTEFTHLSMFDLAIIKWVAWQIFPMLNKNQDANMSLAEYIKIREEKYSLYKRRPDISNSSDAALKGRL